MKILWICHFSNAQIREKLNFSDSTIESFCRNLFRKPKMENMDYAIWISNGITQFEKNKDIELHIISPHYKMKHEIDEFELKGVHYHFFKPDDDNLLKKVLKYFFNKSDTDFKGNRKIVKSLIDKVKPDLIHMTGAENPYYSIVALDVDVAKIPMFVSLQTLMSDSDFFINYPISLTQYQLRSGLESEILKKVNYIGSEINKYREIVWESINPHAIFFNSCIAIGENLIPSKVDKVFDFVYFSASIDKAADIAIEAFAIACQKKSSLTLNIIGGSTPSFSEQITRRISELGIENNIIFSGKLPTHEEVLVQIQKSMYALLPLKIDIIAGTIREAMYCGIPVLTTRTYGTPSLNEKRESVLISEQEDYDGIAKNMIRLVESPELAEKLRENGLITVKELWDSNIIFINQVKTYQAILDYHNYNKPIPVEIGKSNPKLNENR